MCYNILEPNYLEIIGIDIWVKIIENQLNMMKTENIVITDCRFENEFALLTKYGGKIIHVYRSLPSWFESYKATKTTNDELIGMHRSELEWIQCQFDYELSNESTIEELYAKVRNIVKMI